jgi:phenylalanyl-tRNA synthetase alpha subunit
LEIEGHPVRKLWREIRKLLPDLEVIELDEVCDKSSSVLPPDQLAKHVYHIDDRRMLRPEFTSQILERWLRCGGPVRWITAGRLFRPADAETGKLLQVFHQAEVLWAGEGFDDRRCAEIVLDLASKLLPGVRVREGKPYGFRGVPQCRNFEALWDGQWSAIGGGGAVSEELLVKAHTDPKRMGVVSFALGLERTVQIRDNIPDARLLWQPPYVP